MNTRALPPICWDGMSLTQIWEHLNPAESEEDVYRLVDQFGEWAETITVHSRQHEQHWTDSNSVCGTAHRSASDFSATTRAELAAGVADLQQMQSSLETLTAAFVEVRRRVERLYHDTRSAQEPELNWLLAGDDEPAELTSRDNTQWARELMRQYEQTANEELRKWPPEPQTVPAGHTGEPPAPFSGDDTPTRPARVDPMGGAALPLSPEDDAVHHIQVHAPDQLFDQPINIAPPVIGAEFEFERDEDQSW